MDEGARSSFGYGRLSRRVWRDDLGEGNLQDAIELAVANLDRPLGPRLAHEVGLGFHELARKRDRVLARDLLVRERDPLLVVDALVIDQIKKIARHPDLPWVVGVGAPLQLGGGIWVPGDLRSGLRSRPRPAQGWPKKAQSLHPGLGFAAEIDRLPASGGDDAARRGQRPARRPQAAARLGLRYALMLGVSLSEGFFQLVRLSAMILVDCMAAWLMVAYSTISRCMRALSRSRRSRKVCSSRMTSSMSCSDAPTTRSSSEPSLVATISLSRSGGLCSEPSLLASVSPSRSADRDRLVMSRRTNSRTSLGLSADVSSSADLSVLKKLMSFPPFNALMGRLPRPRLPHANVTTSRRFTARARGPRKNPPSLRAGAADYRIDPAQAVPGSLFWETANRLSPAQRFGNRPRALRPGIRPCGASRAQRGSSELTLKRTSDNGNCIRRSTHLRHG